MAGKAATRRTLPDRCGASRCFEPRYRRVQEVEGVESVIFELRSSGM